MVRSSFSLVWARYDTVCAVEIYISPNAMTVFLERTDRQHTGMGTESKASYGPGTESGLNKTNTSTRQGEWLRTSDRHNTNEERTWGDDQRDR